jgi:eukaryotic-like serine/threonine-protein kinase
MSLAPAANLLSPGVLLGRYQILRLLSVGGMGELYLARASGIEGFEKVVVLKRIHPHFAARPEFEQMLLDEARLMGTLHHPNIVQVYDVARHEGYTFFTMEYVYGDNLRNVLKVSAQKGRGLSLTNALWIVSNVAAGLHYAHQKKRSDGTPLRLVHRDVSPGNIMLSHDGAIKLVDFGVAKASVQQARTAPGAIKGHVRYMSPEQCLGNVLDHRSDQFSLGIVLFELTTGTRWIRERDDYDAVQRMLNEPFPKPSERRACAPARRSLQQRPGTAASAG